MRLPSDSINTGESVRLAPMPRLTATSPLLPDSETHDSVVWLDDWLSRKHCDREGCLPDSMRFCCDNTATFTPLPPLPMQTAKTIQDSKKSAILTSLDPLKFQPVMSSPAIDKSEPDQHLTPKGITEVDLRLKGPQKVASDSDEIFSEKIDKFIATFVYLDSMPWAKG